MENDRELLIRYLDGELKEDERGRLSVRLAQEKDLHARLERLRRLRHALQVSRPASFAPFFSQRVVERLAPAAKRNGAEALYQSLRWLFARTAVAGLVGAAALGAYNAVAYQDIGVFSSIAEAVLGLPSTSFVDALSYPTL